MTTRWMVCLVFGGVYTGYRHGEKEAEGLNRLSHNSAAIAARRGVECAGVTAVAGSK